MVHLVEERLAVCVWLDLVPWESFGAVVDEDLKDGGEEGISVEVSPVLAVVFEALGLTGRNMCYLVDGKVHY